MIAHYLRLLLYKSFVRFCFVGLLLHSLSLLNHFVAREFQFLLLKEYSDYQPEERYRRENASEEIAQTVEIVTLYPISRRTDYEGLIGDCAEIYTGDYHANYERVCQTFKMLHLSHPHPRYMNFLRS